MDDTQGTMLSPSSFLNVPQPAEEAGSEGSVLFETSVAIRGGTLSIRVVQTGEGVEGQTLELQAAGGLRKPAPIKLDRYQAEALRIALLGAVTKAQQ